MEQDAFDRTEVQRAKYTIYLNSACCAGWCVINAAGAVLLGAVHLWGLFAASAAMILSWTFALRDLRHGFVIRGVLNYVVSGLLLLLAMSLSVPEMALLFVFATFIFLAFGLSYADRAASLWIVAMTLVVAATMLVTSLGLQWKSGVDPHLLRWVNLVGMAMALSIDAIQFIALRETLTRRGEVKARLANENAMLVATLEQRVRERTAELELANKELEAFSYSVSHDLRSPLRAIDGFSHALADEYADRLDEVGHRYLARIRAGTQRMGTLMDGLLALARIGRAPLKIASVDVSRIAEEAIAELRHRDPDRVVSVRIASDLVIRADARLVAIAFENLLGNAWKFTAKQPNAQIEIGARGDALFVRDNGAGFDMAHATKLYAPFQRLHGPSEFMGDGIGLATVARIVSHHRGRIWAESAVGEGATFYVTFGEPAQRAPA